MNDWEKKFGAKRRRLDRKLIAELERSLPAEVIPLRPPAGPEELGRAQTAKNSQGPSAASCEAPEPDIDFDNEAAKRIAAAFGRKVR